MNYFKGDVVLLPYPFTDLSARKVRPAAVVSTSNEKYPDIFIVPLTSKINNLSRDEAILLYWQDAGLNVPTAFKRGCILIDTGIIIKKVGILNAEDIKYLDSALKKWLELE